MSAARGSASRRSPREWALRIALACGLAGVAVPAVTRSLAAALPNGQAARAHGMAPGDAIIAGDLAEQLTGPESSRQDRARAVGLAQSALQRDPTVVKAVVALATDALLRGDAALARRRFDYSERLSRRDLRTQLWAIEDAVTRGDIPQALRHYDIALRTKATAPELLFPVLGSAIEEPSVRTALVQTLLSKPLWHADFIDYVGGNGSAPRATAQLFAALARAGSPVPQSAAASVISALIVRGDPADAWAIYAARRPGVDRLRSRDPRFGGEIDHPSAFDWSTVADAGLSASIQGNGRHRAFVFAAPPGVGGVVLQQLQLLAPGSYMLVGRSSDLAAAAGALPYWTLSCRGGEEIGRVEMTPSDQAGGRFGGSFTVPSGCAVQTLSLVLRPSDDIAGVSGQIDVAALRPAR